jgi:hypothetical protein
MHFVNGKTYQLVFTMTDITGLIGVRHWTRLAWYPLLTLRSWCAWRPIIPIVAITAEQA